MSNTSSRSTGEKPWPAGGAGATATGERAAVSKAAAAALLLLRVLLLALPPAAPVSQQVGTARRRRRQLPLLPSPARTHASRRPAARHSRHLGRPPAAGGQHYRQGRYQSWRGSGPSALSPSPPRPAPPAQHTTAVSSGQRSAAGAALGSRGSQAALAGVALSPPLDLLRLPYTACFC
jgi:hypothetical protein